MNWRKVLLELTRVVVGIVFVTSGLLKGIDPVGFSMKLIEYIVPFVPHSTWMRPILLFVAVAICFVEFILGAFVLMGVYRKTTSRVLFAFMLLMTGVSVYSYFFTDMIDCGCFGDAIKLTPWETLLKNLVLLSLVYLLVKSPREIEPVFSVRERLLLSVLSGLGFVAFVYANLYYLPYRDFLPYRIGDNIREKIELRQQEIQSTDFNNIRYVYRRQNEVREFSIDSLPKEGWTFVEIKDKGQQDPLRGYDFELFDYNGEEVSASVLADSAKVFLLVSEDWIRADQQGIDVLNELASLADERGYKFYGVWSGDMESEGEWRYQTGATYPMLKMDKTSIRSLIRANPGLIVLKGGTIVDKLSTNMLPDSQEIEAFVESRLTREERSRPGWGRVAILYIWGLSLVAGAIRSVLRVYHSSLMRAKDKEQLV